MGEGFLMRINGSEEAMKVATQTDQAGRWHAGKVSAGRVLVAVLLAGALGQSSAFALNPESPEVQKVVQSALGFLEKNPDERLGGKCLVALAFLKAGQPTHARIREAVDACAEKMKANPGDAVLDVYSNGLAVIFLCELAPTKYAREIEWYLGRLKARQKGHGGWGYHDYLTGDTSQSQYGALAYWEANRRGFSVDGGSLENLADWLMKTQDPEGCWGYQGQVPENDSPRPQVDTNCSMLAAGLGSTYICADLLDIKKATVTQAPTSSVDSSLPAALRPVDQAAKAGGPKKIPVKRTSAPKLLKTISDANAWLAKNYTLDLGTKVFYYLYGLERAKSFKEAFEAAPEENPKWYNDGYEFLAKEQAADGSWSGHCGAPCDTAFSILFLLRSTQKSIQAKLGEGMLASGRGLPNNLARAKMKNGQLIVEQVHTKVDELLSMIDGGDQSVLDDLASDPSQLVVEQVDEKSARRLQQLVRGGEPEARLLAVRALGRTGNLDYVPSLLYALTDPDRRIVLEARNNLRFISRNFDGFGPPDDFTDEQRFQAVDAWKNWYKSLRPTAVLEK
jgi:hypothetical protein